MKKTGILILCFSFLNICIMADDNIISQPLRIEADISLFEMDMDISFLNLDNRHPLILVNTSDLLPYFIVHFGDFTFTIAFRNNIVRAIFFGEPRVLIPDNLFKTPEGVFLGMSYHDLLKLFPNIELTERSGFAYEARLPSGWKIGFTTGNGATDYFPNPGDIITMIFKN